ncbi:MAG TPA: AAA family ATPase [Polyangiaceae bacterium]|nr:AAA family ATPase [Polyangiaceae bacterium]
MSLRDTHVYEFGPFQLNGIERQLSCNGQLVPLTDKVFELLLLLVQNHGRVLAKAELMNKLWPDTVVEENNLTVNVSTLRKALGEGPSERRYIETLARRGYRFVCQVRALPATSAAPVPRRYQPTFVGREQELARLEQFLEAASEGHGRVVLITGGPGMGKTELSEQFLARLHDEPDRYIVATGRCLEQYGAGEVFLPFLEAIRALLMGFDGEQVSEVLRRHAPTWCNQFPSALIYSDGPESSSREALGATSARMLRELADALEALSQIKPVVLSLEDMHWSDPSSSDLLRMLAQRIGRWRGLILATFRDEQVELGNHPLKNIRRELSAHDLCEEIALPLLRPEAIANYLDARCEPHDFPSGLAELIAQRSEGQPLFATRLVQLLIERGDIEQSEGRFALRKTVPELNLGVPETVRGLIERKLELLSEPDLRALQYASVIGAEFGSLTLATLLGEDEVALEERLDQLARLNRLVESLGEERLPDGRFSVRYRFAHWLYQSVIYDGLAAKRRMLLHAQIADSLLLEYGGETQRVAGQLASHLKAARDFPRAIHYVMLAADNASRLHANREATQHYTEALSLIPELSSAERVAYSIVLRYNLGWCHFKVGDLAASVADFEAMLELACAPEFVNEEPDCLAARERVFAYFAEPWRDAFGLCDMARMPNQSSALGPSAIQCEAYWALCYILLCVDRLDEMGTKVRAFLTLAEVWGNEPRRAEALAWMATRELKLGNLQATNKLLEAATPRARAIGHRRALVVALHAQGRAYDMISAYERAEAMYTEAVGLAIEAEGRMDCLLGLARARIDLGRISAALAALGEANDIARRTLQESSMQLVSAGLGRLFLELGGLDQAERHTLNACELGERSGLPTGVLHALATLARVHVQRGDFAAAGAVLSKAEALLGGELSAGLRDATGLASAPSAATPESLRGERAARERQRLHFDLARAEYCLARGDFEFATTHARGLLESARTIGARKHIALAHQLLARVSLARGEPLAARGELAAALEILTDCPMPFLSCRLHAALNTAELALGRAPAARQAFQRALEIASQVTNEIEDDTVRSIWLGSALVVQLRGERRGASFAARS